MEQHWDNRPIDPSTQRIILKIVGFVVFFIFQKSYLTAKGSLLIFFWLKHSPDLVFLPIKVLDICLCTVLFSKYPLIKRVWPDTCLNSFFIIQCKFGGSFFNRHQFLLGHYLWPSDPLPDLLSIWPWSKVMRVRSDIFCDPFIQKVFQN